MPSANSPILYSKENTRIQLLKLIATHTGLTRPKLAAMTDLSRMSVSNMAAELISADLVAEYESTAESAVSGRKPLCLKLSDRSPCVCGMLIEQDMMQVMLGDLSGAMLTESVRIPFSSVSLTHDGIIGALYDTFRELEHRTSRSILAIGIASLGPLDAKQGVILRPPFFHKIENLPITERLSDLTGLPVFLMNEANACALAEHLYGDRNDTDQFLYLYIKNGIGAGVVLNGRLYDGVCGQNGGLGHVSVNAFGPECECGSRGCLELYANLEQLRRKIDEMNHFYPGSRLSGNSRLSWTDILDAAHAGDLPAILALDEFCRYMALAVNGTLNILDLPTIIIDYPLHAPGDVLETLLSRNLSKLRPASFYHDVSIRKSLFIGQAATLGAIAIVADKVFRMELSLRI